MIPGSASPSVPPPLGRAPPKILIKSVAVPLYNTLSIVLKLLYSYPNNPGLTRSSRASKGAIQWSTKYSHRAQSEPRCVGRAVYGAGRCGTYEGGCAANTCVRIARVFSGWGSNIWSSSSAGLLVVALSARPTCGRHTFYANLSDVTHMNKHLVH